MTLALSMGDPSGIGIELALKAWQKRATGIPPFILLADPAHVERTAHALRLDIPILIAEPREAGHLFTHALPILPLMHEVHGTFAAPDPNDANATIEAIVTGVKLIEQKKISALVTNPISKASLYAAGFAHPGHTEFLASLASDIMGKHAYPVMMLWSPTLACVPVTVHIPLAQVALTLTTELLIKTCRIVAQDLQHRFAIKQPRLALAGINPHAGENGYIGQEEIEIITPAITALQNEGINITGPHPADTLFHEEARKRYDVAICPYHDQALIPIKTLAFDSAVNVTLGLPFIRTSPDHGTAYDIAGKGIANPASLIAALKLAGTLAKQ